MEYHKLGRDIVLGIENLKMHKLRSFLTILGVVFGVCSVVAMLSVGEGASKKALEQIRKLGSNNIIISSKKPITETNKVQQSMLSMYGLKYLDYERIKESYPKISKIAEAKILRKEGRLNDKSIELRIVGTSESWFDLVPRNIIAGRCFTKEDVESVAPVAVLTDYGARKLLANNNTIGEVIRIGSDSYKVIGIIQSEDSNSSQMQIPDSEIDAYIPISVAKQYYGDFFFKRQTGSFTMENVELHQIILSVEDIHDVEPTAAAINRMLEMFHKNKDYEVNVPLALLRQAEATERTFNIVLGSIAGISLLVGGVGIMNIMLASVTERTREIGIRRAIGAKRNQIIVQFLIETIVLSTLGGIIGIIIGVCIPVVITFFTEMPTVITPASVILPFGISIAIGLIFGIYPAANAAKVDPIVALRHE